MSNKIFDIRGNHGSGKSTLVRNILKRHYNEIIEGEKVPYHFVPKLNLCILGKYLSKGGGVDNLSTTSNDLQNFIVEKLKSHNVMFEGIIISETYSRWNELAEIVNDNYIFIYLNVDLEECILRVEDRRINNGQSKDFNHANIVSKSRQIKRTVEKLKGSGRTVIQLNYPSQKEAYKLTIRLIKETLNDNTDKRYKWKW